MSWRRNTYTSEHEREGELVGMADWDGPSSRFGPIMVYCMLHIACVD